MELYTDLEESVGTITLEDVRYELLENPISIERRIYPFHREKVLNHAIGYFLMCGDGISREFEAELREIQACEEIVVRTEYPTMIEAKRALRKIIKARFHELLNRTIDAKIPTRY